MSATISPLPPAAQPTDDRSTFNTKEFAHRAALPQFVDEANALAAEVEGNALDAEQSAIAADEAQALAEGYRDAAASSANLAAGAGGAVLHNPATTYAQFAPAISSANYLVYRRKTAGSSATDPSADPTNWAPATVGGPQVQIHTGTTATVTANTRAMFTNAAQCTATLPAAPADLTVVEGRFLNGRTDNVFDRNGQQIEGMAENNTWNFRGPWKLQFFASYGGWRFIA